MNAILYLLRETLRSLRQEWRMVSISILTIGITLFFFLTIALALGNLSHWVNLQEEEVAMQLYGEMYLTPEEEHQLALSIISREDISSVTVITREEGYEQFKELYGAKLLNAVDVNPFPMSLAITPVEDYPVEKLSYLASTLQLLPGVASVTFSSQWLQQLLHFKRRATSTGAVVLAILFIAIFFAIRNTVQLTVFARQDLIVNMQYVGASALRIKSPFLLEGALEGAAGALFALALVFVLKSTLFSSFSLLWPQSLFASTVVITGAVLGLFSGYAAIRPFVK